MSAQERFALGRAGKRLAGALTLAVAMAATGASAPSAAPAAATPITASTCPQTVSGSVRLETDLLCMDTSGLIAGSDNTSINLNGHEILCVGSG